MKLSRNILVAGVLAMGFGGCLKDVSRTMDPNLTQSVVEFANTANLTSPTTSKYPLLSVNIPMQAATTYNAVISYSGIGEAPEDITVTVGLADAQVLADYNTANKTTYTALPTANFTLPQTTVVIPKGQRRVNFPINLVNTDQIYGKNYVLALNIKSVTGNHIISGNFNNMLFLMSGINKLDGIYELRFKFAYPTGVTPDRNYDLFPIAWYYSDIQMVTASTTQSTLRNINAGTSATAAVHAASANGLPTNIPTFVPLVTYDIATNKITAVKNNVAASGTNTRTAVLNTASGVDNKVDPATGNIYVSFILQEPGKADMIVYDTLRFKTPRP